MQEKIGELHEAKASRNIEFAKIIVNDTSETNFDKIDYQIKSISQTLNRKIEKNVDKLQ